MCRDRLHRRRLIGTFDPQVIKGTDTYPLDIVDDHLYERLERLHAAQRIRVPKPVSGKRDGRVTSGSSCSSLPAAAPDLDGGEVVDSSSGNPSNFGSVVFFAGSSGMGVQENQCPGSDR